MFKLYSSYKTVKFLEEGTSNYILVLLSDNDSFNVCQKLGPIDKRTEIKINNEISGLSYTESSLERIRNINIIQKEEDRKELLYFTKKYMLRLFNFDEAGIYKSQFVYFKNNKHSEIKGTHITMSLEYDSLKRQFCLEFNNEILLKTYSLLNLFDFAYKLSENAYFDSVNSSVIINDDNRIILNDDNSIIFSNNGTDITFNESDNKDKLCFIHILIRNLLSNIIIY